MAHLLGEEYPAFAASLAESPMVGLRVNTLKIASENLRRRLPLPLSPVEWCSAGFSCASTPEPAPKIGGGEITSPGKHPYHAAGLYYLQEPSAMAVAELLEPRAGERVLDVSAAPGGKTTHLAALMQNAGLLIANEIHPRRVWDLAENLERCSVRNAAILNETPERLGKFFEHFFDKVLVDAPCSGEGMFRKSEGARAEWSPRLVEGCALRQASILEACATMVRPGGKLAYSTCTFNPHENEATLARFLHAHPDFEPLETRRCAEFAEGQPQWAGNDAPLSLRRAVRLWPHRLAGEGHFVAILERAQETRGEEVVSDHLSRHTKAVPKPLLQQYRNFCHEALNWFPGEENLALVGMYLYALPDGLPDLSGLRVIHPGWWLGSFKKARFEPSHALAMGLESASARRVINLEMGSTDVMKFLRGESLLSSGEEGWLLVTVDSHPLGWGKRVDGVVKNFYPKGLRPKGL
jgi:NOL1/NOP2/sun family putative RNA methylase